MTAIKETPHLFLSTTHTCSYLPNQTASTLFIDPRYPVSPELLGDFNRRGFRRSGDLIYRPHCPGCQACVPVRIPVKAFSPRRAQRRTAVRNDDIVVSARPAGFDAEHFALFRRYQDTRHAGGAMADPDAATYLRFLVSRHSATTFHEFRIAGTLVGVAVVDVLPDGLSAVYTFYDPSLTGRGLGTYAILWQIAETHRRGLPFLYLGYWVKDSAKMAYKTRFQPLEAYRNGRWSPFDQR